MHLTHPKTILTPLVHGKIVFHKTGPWYQTGWGLLKGSLYFNKQGPFLPFYFFKTSLFKKKKTKKEYLFIYLWLCWVFFGASFIAQLVKNLPAMPETPVRFLGQEDSLGKG